MNDNADPIEEMKWREALAEPDKRKWPSVVMSHPEQGYYRIKKKGLWQPMCYLYENGELYCCIGEGEAGKPLNEVWLGLREAIEGFSWAWSNPVSKKAYEAVMAGGLWPDLDKIVAEQMAAPKIGHNQPPTDLLEQFRIDIETASKAVENYKEVTEETNAAARSAQARLQELASTADKKRAEIKAPYLVTCQQIDEDWGSLVKKAKAAAQALGKAMGLWETKKAAALRAQEAEAQAAADRAIASGMPPSAMEAPIPAPITPAPATRIKGGYGRAGHVYIERVILKITDYDALAMAYINHHEVRMLVERLAAADVKNGHTPSGVTIGEERNVR